jgi:hypothetical protein
MTETVGEVYRVVKAPGWLNTKTSDFSWTYDTLGHILFVLSRKRKPDECEKCLFLQDLKMAFRDE